LRKRLLVEPAEELRKLQPRTLKRQEWYAMNLLLAYVDTNQYDRQRALCWPSWIGTPYAWYEHPGTLDSMSEIAKFYYQRGRLD